MSRYFPGQSGNPGGRPRRVSEIRRLAAKYMREAIETLAECLKDEDGRVRVAAANALLDRAGGRAAVEISDVDAERAELEIELLRKRINGEIPLEPSLDDELKQLDELRKRYPELQATDNDPTKQ